MRARIKQLEEKRDDYERMLKAMSGTVSVKENRHSLLLANTVTNCVDDDHVSDGDDDQQDNNLQGHDQQVEGLLGNL